MFDGLIMAELLERKLEAWKNHIGKLSGVWFYEANYLQLVFMAPNVSAVVSYIDVLSFVQQICVNNSL